MKFKIIAILQMLVFMSSAYGTAPVPCEKPAEETIRKGLISILDFHCNDPDDCGVLVSAPSVVEGRKFLSFNVYKGNLQAPDFILQIQSTINQNNQEATMYGKLESLEKLHVGVAYESVDFCGLTSSVPLQHYKALKRDKVLRTSPLS